MKLRVLAVGKLAEPFWRAGCDEYLKRLTRYAKTTVTEVADRSLSQGEDRARAAEGAALLKLMPADSHVVALEIGGRQMSSKGFSTWLAGKMSGGVVDIAFIIGGSAGLSAEVLQRADERLSLSPMTLPHQMCRVVLLEQIYRAFRIMRNEPYHR